MLDRPRGRIRPSVLGDRLRQLRGDHRLRMRDVADALSTDAARVSDWENGVNQPRLTTLTRYAGLFGLTVSELLDGVM